MRSLRCETQTRFLLPLQTSSAQRMRAAGSLSWHARPRSHKEGGPSWHGRDEKRRNREAKGHFGPACPALPGLH
ncbi:uncharacterized [Tachysurus ichikawai]